MTSISLFSKASVDRWTSYTFYHGSPIDLFSQQDKDNFLLKCQGSFGGAYRTMEFITKEYILQGLQHANDQTPRELVRAWPYQENLPFCSRSLVEQHLPNREKMYIKWCAVQKARQYGLQVRDKKHMIAIFHGREDSRLWLVCIAHAAVGACRSASPSLQDGMYRSR